MDPKTLSTEQLREMTKTEIDTINQRKIIQELVDRQVATVIVSEDTPRSIRAKVMAITPKDCIPKQWFDNLSKPKK